jgi:hypothetical protein
MQLFRRAHMRRLQSNHRNHSFYQLIGSYSRAVTPRERDSVDTEDQTPRVRASNPFGEPPMLPFMSAPISHWVHLDAPPPGPHSPLVAVRLAGADRCLAVDSNGVFHSFRWAWRAEEADPEGPQEEVEFDQGCFIVQRELPRFRAVPRLMHTPQAGDIPAVAISKTLFAGRTVLLILSDGDGRGSLGIQLVDPAKGTIKGEVLMPAIHSARITCIATDPFGTAAGHGGVGGELALLGSADGSASLWRFMSSQYLPLRPRIRLQGISGSKIFAAALCSSIQLAATVSSDVCSIYAITNGTQVRSFGPPEDSFDLAASSPDISVRTKFADTQALGISVQGFVVTVCESLITTPAQAERSVVSLQLFTTEGVCLGSHPLAPWRGLPRKITCTPDGTAAIVCCGRGVSFHRLSACEPLAFIDEWTITESDELGSSEKVPSAFDADFGPSLNRPVVAAAGCSNGVLRLHALPGISAWSERHKKSGLGQSVGTALSKPAQKIKNVVQGSIGIGRHLAGIGRDIGREVTSDVKNNGVSGFLGNVFGKGK